MPRQITSLVLCTFLFTLTGTAEQVVETELLIVGATESGWAAAIQAARCGLGSITIVHDGRWYGGQFTEQALACVDENKGVGKVGWGVAWHPMKRSFHRSGLFKELMDRIEAFNMKKYGSPMPGIPHHGPSTFRPAEAEAIFREMIQPYIDSGQVQVFWNRYAVGANLSDSCLRSVTFAASDSKADELVVRATMTIDASDWGDVIQVCGAAFECGPDPRSRYNEPSAPEDLSNNPGNEMNPITWAMIVEQSQGDTPIEKPQRFDDRNFPRATHSSLREFGNLQWDHPKPGLGAIAHWPPAGTESKRQLSVYSVRRIVDGYTSKDGKTSILLNYMNGQDYPLERLPKHVCDALEADEKGASMKNIVRMSRQQRQIVFDDAKRHSLCMLYHMQNFVHNRVTDTTNSFRGFHLSDEFGTADNLPPKPYIRESLRLRAMYMMREQDSRNRDGETKTKATERFAAVMYPDGLFAWQFHYDFHRTGRTFLKREGSSGPWIDYHKTNRHTKFLSDRSVFPMRSLIPERIDGLLGAQGNVGYSSIVSAAIRLHDQRIHIGQAAGATATLSVRRAIAPRAIPYDRELLEEVRDTLCGTKCPGTPLLIWPFRDLVPSHPAFVAVNRLAALGVLPIGKRNVDFRADDPATNAWVKTLLNELPSETNINATDKTRGQTCLQIWNQIRTTGLKSFAFANKISGDADEDGIRDTEDALLFTANEPIAFTIEKPTLTESEDGIPNAEEATTTAGRKLFDFCGRNTRVEKPWIRDWGQPFDNSRNFGWERKLTANYRQRNLLPGPRDSFIFTRDEDSWQCKVSNGKYRVTVCIGDSGHDQPGQNVSVEGTVFAKDIATVAGGFSEVTKQVEVSDGTLNVIIGKPNSNSNTAINWLLLEPN